MYLKDQPTHTQTQPLTTNAESIALKNTDEKSIAKMYDNDKEVN